jgi:hypothetical protein
MPFIVDDIIAVGLITAFGGGYKFYKNAADGEEQKSHDQAATAQAQVPTVIVLGEPSVGKTCLMKRLCDGEFVSPSEATIGASFHKYSGNRFDGRPKPILAHPPFPPSQTRGWENI